MIDENTLHGTGRGMGSVGGGITLQIEKNAETAGALKAYIYVIMDAQLKLYKGAFYFCCQHCSWPQVALEKRT